MFGVLELALTMIAQEIPEPLYQTEALPPPLPSREGREK